MRMENYYKVLGVTRFASKEEIRRAYIKTLKTYHPDIYKGDKKYAEKITSEANVAFEFLSDPVKKLQLDDFLNRAEFENLNNKKNTNPQTSQPKQNNATKSSQSKQNNATKPKPKNKKQFDIFDFFTKHKKKSKNIATDNAIKKEVKEKLSNRKHDFSHLKLNILIGLIVIAILTLIILLIVLI